MAVVFLSSSFTELREYRKAAFEAIDKFGHQCIRMENFPAADRQIPDFCREKVQGCGLFVLILGKLYGSLIPERDISYTEDEFDLAIELKVPILVFTASVSAQVNLEAALDRSALDYKEHRKRLAAFQKKALTGRLGKEYGDPGDLRESLGHSLHEHSKSAQAAPQAIRYSGEMLPGLCDRTSQIESFGEAFETGLAGRPEIYVVHGHELEQHKNCVQRLLCYHITYPKRGAASAMLAPPNDRAVIEWPSGDDPEDILFNRLCRRLLQAMSPGCGAPQPNAVEMFCRLAIETKTPYIRFRHVFHASDWTGSTQSLCLKYLAFWANVQRHFASQAVAAPRTLVFFEFSHRFTEAAESQALRDSLKKVFMSDAAGEGLLRQVLPELPSVQFKDFEVWYQRFGERLLPQYQNKELGEIFPSTPVPMIKAQSKLRQLLGLDTHGE